MLSVLLLFLLPVGGGIPAGVLLARAQGLPWPLTAGLYALSDVLLALVFEPILHGLVALGRRVAAVARLGLALKQAMARSVELVGGVSAGPFMLVMIAFGVDPMTGRASALAAGHGFLAGWVFAITGDLLYYGVVAVATLRLNATLKDPTITVWVMLGTMLLLPVLLRRLRQSLHRKGAGARPDPQCTPGNEAPPR